MPANSPESQPSAGRNIYVFGITSFLNDTASEMAYWVLPAFLVSLGAGPAQLGLIEGLAESVASFAKLFSGYLTDRIDRRKPLVVAGYFFANAVKPFLAVVGAWWHILLIRFTDRLAKGVRGAPRDVMVAESVPKQRLGAAYGLIQSMDSAGAIVGPLAALVLLARYGIRSVFLAAAVPGALTVLVALFGIREPKRRQSEDGSRSREGSRSSVATGVAAGIFLFCAGCGDAFFAGEFERHVSGDAGAERGNPGGAGALLGLVFNITYTLGSWPAGWFSDHFSRRWIAAAGYLIFAAVLFRVRASAVYARYLDHDGGLRFVLCADAAGVEGIGGGGGWG